VNIKTKLILLVFVIGAGAVGLSFKWLKGRFFQNKSLEQLWEAKSVTPEEFTRLYISLFKEIVPDCQVKTIAPLKLEIKKPGKDNMLTSFLDNAYKESQFCLEQRKETCARYINGFLKSSAANRNSHAIDPNKIIPVIKDRRFIDSLPPRVDSQKPIIYENLIADIYVTYAVDEESSVRYLLPSDFNDLNMSLEQLRVLAKENLHKIIPDAELRQSENGFLVEADHLNEPSLLLFDSFWEKVKQQTQGQIIAAVPSRGLLLFTTKETEGGIDDLKKIVREVSESDPYLISETLLIRQNGKWEVFREDINQ
jgi:uncharacterized protein YtpQ (UPF0354 family)